jgi:hypothetical protein
LPRDFDTLDFSGWPIYASAALAPDAAFEICAAIAARAAEVPWEEPAHDGIWRMGRDSETTPMDVPLHPGAERWYREHAGSAG